jgi:hypothetical protein
MNHRLGGDVGLALQPAGADDGHHVACCIATALGGLRDPPGQAHDFG